MIRRVPIGYFLVAECNRYEEVTTLRRLRFLTLLSIASLAVSGVAYGSGFSIFEQGAKATAMGGAFAATADDPSAIFYNVAGIAQLRRTEVNLGGTAINFTNEFRGDINDPTTSGLTGEYRAHTFVPPNAYAVMPIGNNLTIGVGSFAAFGLRTNWADPFPGRYISRDANVKTVSIEPAIAWQSTDGRIAIGAGPEYRRSHITLVRNNFAFNPFTQRFADAVNAYLNSEWNSAWGWNAGVLFKPANNWRIGASYRAPMTIDYEGDATFTQIPTGNPFVDAGVKAQLPANQAISTAIDFPAIAAIGLAHSTQTWDLELDVTHTSWSRFQSLDVVFPSTPALSFTRPQNWEDTRSYRFGANGRASQHWDVRFGAVYDENPQPTEGVGPLLPDSDRIGLCFGFGWHNGPLTFDFGDMFLHFKKRSTQGLNQENPPFNGTYKTDANLFGFNLGYKF
jgi:long-chain fatty acid transport protein